MRFLLTGVAGCVLAFGPCSDPAPPSPPPTTMACDGDPTDPLHCSSSHGQTVCDTDPELCQP